MADAGEAVKTFQWEDPLDLTAPLVRPSTFRRDPNLTGPALQPFEVAEELPSLEKGQVPAYPLGTRHPEYAAKHHLPFEASQGGAHTMYPEYARRLEELMPIPASSTSATK